MQVAHTPLPKFWQPKCLQPLPNVPWRSGGSLSVENHCSSSCCILESARELKCLHSIPVESESLGLGSRHQHWKSCPGLLKHSLGWDPLPWSRQPHSAMELLLLKYCYNQALRLATHEQLLHRNNISYHVKYCLGICNLMRSWEFAGNKLFFVCEYIWKST